MSPEFDAFALHLNRVEVWRRGTVVLVPDPVPPGLAALHALIAECLRRSHVVPDAGPFRPHLKLARNAGRIRAPRACDIRWLVTGFDLVQSQPGTGAYRVVHHCEAKPPAVHT